MKTNKHSLEIIAPDPRRHRDEMFDLIAKVFSHAGYYAFRDYCRQKYIDHSFYDWSASRIGLIGGRIVTHWGVWDYRMRVGSALLRTGGVGVVATNGDYRGRGYMAGTGEASIEAMTGMGYDMTILFGIREFYHRFGYVRGWSDHAYFVSLADLPKGRPPALRKFTNMLDPQLTQLANRAYDGLTGTAVRPTYQQIESELQKGEGYSWTDAAGRLTGYVIALAERGNANRVWIADAIGQPPEVFSAVAAVMRRKKATEVRFTNLHHDSLLARALRQMNCRQEIYNRRSGGPMIRTLNLRSCLTKMRGELTGRLRASALAAWSGRLLIADPRESVVLDIRRGAVRVGEGASARHAIRGGEHIARLLIGTDEPAETVRAGGIKLTGDAPALLAALFPAQHPMLPSFDHY